MSAFLQRVSVMACARASAAPSPMPHADAQDMHALRAGDQSAFRRIVCRHQGRLLAYCIRLINDSSGAQDITQDVFLTLWRERKRYQERNKLQFYLLGIARLRCLAHLKKHRAHERLRDRAVELQMVAGQSSTPRFAEDAELQAALIRLTSEHRDLLVLRHMEGLELSEIKELTGLRLGTIKSRLHRGLAALREELDHDQ